MGSAIPRLTNKKISVAKAVASVPTKEESPPKTAAGFLLLDSSLRPAWFNAEAINIIDYPDKQTDLTGSEVLLAAKVRSRLVSQEARSESSFVAEFRSGRRRYFCRAFVVDSCDRDASHPCIAVLLERGPSGLVPLSRVSGQFNLTQREQEALEYVLQGLSSKAIANRMSISPNTVKAYIRMIMIKTGASSRSAMVSKIILTQPH